MGPRYITAYQVAADPGYSSMVRASNIALVIFISIATLVILAFAWMAYLTIRREAWRKRRILIIFAFGLAVFAMTPVLFFLSVWRSASSGELNAESDALRSIREGQYEVIEGVVTDFVPMPYEGHMPECFSVQEKRFCYSDYTVAPGFHNAASHGGPIRAGLKVRIAYQTHGQHNTILRLETAQS